MALNNKQKQWLDTWSATQPNFKNGQINGNPADDINLGSMLASGQVLDDSLRDQIVNINFQLPANTGSGQAVIIPGAMLPVSGQIIEAKLRAGANLAAATASAGSTDFQMKIENASSSSLLGAAVSVLTGITSTQPLRLPTGQASALLNQGATYVLTASGANLTFEAATSFANQPQVNDWIHVAPTTSSFGGASLVNSGLYKVTAASSTTVTAVKQSRTNPASVSSAISVTADVAAIKVIKQTESMVTADDQIVVSANVGTTAGALVGGVNFLVQLRIRPA